MFSLPTPHVNLFVTFPFGAITLALTESVGKPDLSGFQKIRNISFAIFFKLYSYYQLFNTSMLHASLITFLFLGLL